MTKVLTIVAALSFCAGPGFAADCKTINPSDVMRAEMQRYDAQTGDDFIAMERIIGDDLVYIHSSSVVDDKQAYIDSMRAGTVKYRIMRLVDSQIRVYDCIAVMTGTARFDVTVKGTELTVDLRFTEAWAKRGDDLQFISWQATRIPQQ